MNETLLPIVQSDHAGQRVGAVGGQPPRLAMTLGPDADDTDTDGRVLPEVNPAQIDGPTGLKAPAAQGP